MLRHIPKELRTLWVRCLIRTVAHTVFHNTESAWQELQMLPKAVLCNPPRAGKSHTSQRTAFTRRRLDRWLSGERSSLWNDLPQYNAPRPKRLSPEGDKNRRAQRCIDLVSEGGLGAACKALINDPPLGHSSTIFRKLKDKHPPNHNPPNNTVLPGLLSRPPGRSLHIEGDTVERAVRSFHRLSSGGPSGLKPLHVQAALTGAFRDEAVQHFTSLVQLLAHGEAPRALAPYMAGANLAALPKNDDGVRPIAGGEVWRRVVAKCLCKDSQQAASSLLFPLQIGVAQPLGTEVAAHTARDWFHRNASANDKVFLKIDFKNAFNAVDRCTFLQECRLHFPSLSAWVEWCYAEPSHLYFGNQSIESQSGVQQGDPLGPLLFSLALQPILSNIKSTHGSNGLDLVFAYLDDCVLAGRADTVAAAFEDLTNAASAIGLEVALGRDKSLLIPCAKRAASFDESKFPQTLERQWDGNFAFLGSPIGDETFCKGHTADRVTEACKLLSALGELPDPAVALLLLRHCGSFCKLVYSSRVVPHSMHRAALHTFDQAVRDSLENCLSVSFSEEDWSLASLSSKVGGLGLRSSSKHCAAAFLASSISSEDLCRRLDPEFRPIFHSSSSPVSLASVDYNASVSDTDQLAQGAQDVRQQQLSANIDKKTLGAIKAAAAANDPARRAHLELTSADKAGTWLHTIPSQANYTKIDPLLFRTSILRWLRMPISQEDFICPSCDGIMDRFGDHALVCPCGGDRTKRHNLLRNSVYHFATSCGHNAELEKPGLLQPRPWLEGGYENGINPANPQARRPADVYIARWRRGTPIALDFAVTSGMRNVAASTQNAASATSQYEDFKRAHLDTERQCVSEGITFKPMIIEAVGGAWGADASKILSHLAKDKAIASGEKCETVLTHLIQDLGIILHRENARAVLKRLQPTPFDARPLLEAAAAIQPDSDDAFTFQ